MTFYERVHGLCTQRGISITKLATDLGFSASATTTWKNMVEKPKPSTVKKIADYFEIEINEFNKGVEYIDYSKIDTSGFNRPVFEHLLEKHKGNEKRAIKAYLEFEKTQMQEAVSEQHPAFQNYASHIHNSNVVQGDNISSTSQNQTEKTLTDNEKELLRLFSELSVIGQAKVLTFVAELKEREAGNSGSK